jgi:hypothetical protein
MLIGGSFRKFDVSLEVSGETLLPADVSATLGKEATSARAKGERRTTRSGQQIEQATGVWELRESHSIAAARDSKAVEEALTSFLNGLPSDPAIWKKIGAQGRVTVTVTIWFGEENGSARFAPSLLAKLATMDANLLLDVWQEAPSGDSTT